MEIQLFLAHLLVLLALAGQLRFRLVLEACVLTTGLIVGLVISGVESISGEVAIGLSGWSWWNVLMSLQRYSTTKAGSQVFSSSR